MCFVDCVSERNLGNERYEGTTTRPLLSNERRFVSFLFVCVMIYCWTDDVEAMYQLGRCVFVFVFFQFNIRLKLCSLTFMKFNFKS